MMQPQPELGKLDRVSAGFFSIMGVTGNFRGVSCGLVSYILIGIPILALILFFTNV